ncbi:MAG: hypothetical protein LBU89_05550 [Fibromonadaceae bacterium]|nr:hypothetical protein [Fibromonadaceae bacterium]
MLRSFFLILVVCIAAYAQYSWKNVQIWGGGYVPGVSFHPEEEGLTYIRTDVGGAYRLEANKRDWLPLNDNAASGFTSGGDMGSIAIGLDGDDPNMVYVTGGLYLDLRWCGAASFFRSSNKGVSWTKVELNNTNVSGLSNSTTRQNDDGSRFMCLGGNAVNRGTGNRIAAFSNLVLLGTDQNGLLISNDKGNTWSTASEFSNTDGISAVLFDKNYNIFVAPFAGGLYKGNLPVVAGGNTVLNFSKMGTFDGMIFQMSYSPSDHSIWFTTNTDSPFDHSSPSGGSVYKYDISAETFTQITMPARTTNYGYTGISVSPTDPDYILVGTAGWWKGTGSSPLDGNNFTPHEAIFMSTDGGTTWSDILLDASYDTDGAYNAATHNPHWISALAVNPFDSDHVIFGTGYGLWSTFNATAERPFWEFTNRGIEETVPLGLVSTTRGAPLVSVLGDIDGFYHDDIDTPPLRRHKLGDGEAEAGTNFDIDFAGQVPNYMVRIHKHQASNYGNYSEDGGKTWKNFVGAPSVNINPHGENNFVAVSADASAIVWNIAGHGIFRSTNNGTTWTASTASTASLAGFRPVADRVTPGTFYLYNPDTGTLHRSTDNGATWTAVNSNLAVEGGDWARWAFRLYASPDQAGELWATQGTTGISGIWLGGSGGIKRSTDGGSTFATVNGLPYARSIGFGKGTTSGVSAVYAVGIQTDGQPLGVFRSNNSGGTWTRINTNAQSYGEITMVIGDPCIYSRVYLGTSGRGIIYGEEQGNTSSCADREDYGSTTSVLSTLAVKKKEGVRLRFDGTRVQIEKTLPNGEVKIFDLRGR